MNRVKALREFGQSVWLDDLRRDLFTSGEFQRLIDDDGVRGVTSNPSIFEQAIVGNPEYLSALGEIDEAAMTPSSRYEALAVRDIREAADLLRPVYDASGGVDGYVSLEVSPFLARHTVATIGEARRLWNDVGRDNLMIKVPGTLEGVPAIQQLTSEGINVNVTLLFGVERYVRVAHAYMDGLSAFADRGGDPARVNSVASIFVSRIDTAIDRMLQERIDTGNVSERAVALSLQGEVAIANARLAYQRYRTLCRSSRWQALVARGARPQRVLWASTSTKNARYRDVRYVEELIGADTITTLTPATLAAFRDHGRTRESLDERLDDAQAIIDMLPRAGIDLDKVTDTLLKDGLTSFRTAFDSLLAAVAQARPARAIQPAGNGGQVHCG